MVKKSVDKALEAADTNGDGHISMDEIEAHMELEFKRKELEDQDAQRDAIRKMAWFSLVGLLLYPFGIFLTSMFGLETAANLIADIAPTYFASIAVLVSAFFAADAVGGKKKE
jgi:FtsH-binding integral membrane protein